MGALFTALIWLLLLVLLIIVVVISTPVRLDAQFNTQQTPKLAMDIAVLGGLLPIPIKSGTDNQKVKKDRPKNKTGKSKSSIKIGPVIRAGPRLLSSMIKLVKIDKLRAVIGYGFPDPADTGMLYGFLKPLEFWANSHESTGLTIAPDFGVAKLDGRGQFACHFTPITLVPPMVRFGWAAFLLPRFKK